MQTSDLDVVNISLDNPPALSPISGTVTKKLEHPKILKILFPPATKSEENQDNLARSMNMMYDQVKMIIREIQITMTEII